MKVTSSSDRCRPLTDDVQWTGKREMVRPVGLRIEHLNLVADGELEVAGKRSRRPWSLRRGEKARKDKWNGVR